MSNIRNLIDAIEAGKTTEIQQHFEEIMSDKMLNAIEQRKHDIAQGLFKESVEEEQIDEEVDLLEELSQLDETQLEEFLSELDESEIEALLKHIEESEQLDETPKVDQGLSGKQKVAARAARGDNSPEFDVGNTTGGTWRGKDSPSPYKDSNVAKSGKRKGMITKSAIQKTKEKIKSRLPK